MGALLDDGLQAVLGSQKEVNALMEKRGSRPKKETHTSNGSRQMTSNQTDAFLQSPQSTTQQRQPSVRIVVPVSTCLSEKKAY